MLRPGRLLTAMVTPFDREGRLDSTVAADLARHLLSVGSDGLVVCGTTGESPTLSHDEKVQLLRTIVEAVGGAHVIAGTGSNDTRATVALSQEAAELGVDGLLLIAPYYSRPDPEGLFQHFKAVARQLPQLPILLYNHPPRTGVTISARLLGRLVEACPNIIGLKDSSASLDLCSEYLTVTPSQFLLYSGNDTLTLPIMGIGGYGAISVASHIAGPELKEMINQAAENRYERARKLHFKLWGLMNALFATPSPAPVKAALQHYGWDAGSVRLPLVEMPPVEWAKLLAVLEATLGTPQERRAFQEDIGRRTVLDEQAPPAVLQSISRTAEV
ncbi:MAG: 4-hydroxy-tetrahydrodipicolinate synthase [Cyanobacteria bacterium REEB65]|nr:4-hydroxy-tetrahydrodipicolinate synthase [Cyanobacteria bacterium REEB65]